MADTWMRIGSAVLYYSIGTPHPVRTVSPQPINCMGDQFRTRSQLTDVHSRLSGRRPLRTSTERLSKPGRRPREDLYNLHTQNLPGIGLGPSVAIQNPETKVWDTYGTVVGIGPYRCYYVKTYSGRVFVRNRRFLRRRVPLSMPSSDTTAQADPSLPRQATPNIYQEDTSIPSLDPPVGRYACQHKPTKKVHRGP